jgi:hypothetical protein
MTNILERANKLLETVEPLSEREIQLIDGMIEVQRNHADRCDNITNRAMAEKQKGWDMERVALLEKLKTSYSRETVERLLAELTVWAVYHSEECVGSFIQGLFSSEEKAQSWIDTQSNWPKEECFISVMEIDDELRRMAEGEK